MCLRRELPSRPKSLVILLGVSVISLSACTSKNSDCTSCSEIEHSSASGGQGGQGTLVDSRSGSTTGVIGGASAIIGSSVGGAPHASSVVGNGGVSNGGGASHASSVVGNGGVSNGGGAKSTISGTTVFEMPERCTTVSGGVAQSIVQSGATLLDVREPSEFAAFALDGAINIPVGSLTAQMSELNAVKPVVVYCKSGGRAAQAMTLLCDAGYEVFSLGAMSNYPN